MKRPALRCTICGSFFPLFGSDAQQSAERAAFAFRSHACAFNRRVTGIDLDPQLIPSSRPRIGFHPAGGAA